MTKVLLIRHGESTANLNNVFAGNYDAALTARGHEQAECTARFIADTYQVDAIYASDLRRASCTGVHLADMIGLPVYPERGMREISAGEWEGVPFFGIKDTHPAEWAVWINDIGNAVCPNGESVAEMSERIYETLCRLATANDGKTIAVFTHATPIRSMQCRLSGKPLSYMQKTPWVSNASVSELTFEHGCFRAVQFGVDEHLSEMRTVLPCDI